MGAFNYLDANGDSQLSFEEYIKHSLDTTLQHDIFDYFDTNKDGTLQPAEYVETPFRDMDHNGDNVVSRHDYDHYYTNVSWTDCLFSDEHLVDMSCNCNSTALYM